MTYHFGNIHLYLSDPTTRRNAKRKINLYHPPLTSLWP